MREEENKPWADSPIALITTPVFEKKKVRSQMTIDSLVKEECLRSDRPMF